MNKYMSFGLIILWLLLATYLVEVFGLYDQGVTVSGAIDSIDASDQGFLAQISGMLKVFWDIFTFQVTGLPAIIVVIFFTAPAFVIMYMLMDVIKDLVPFT